MYNQVKNSLISFSRDNLNINKSLLKKNKKKKLNYLLKLNKKSILANNNLKNKNHANIYYQNLGRNTFITVSCNNKLIYNKSIGQFKLFNIKIKKREKRRIGNIYAFIKSFNTYFYKVLRRKYKIRSISLYINCLTRSIRVLLKDFVYKYHGSLYGARKSYRKFERYKIRKYLKNKKLLGKNKIRKKFKKKLYILNAIRKYKYKKVFSIRSIDIRQYIAYNGCKKKKMKI